MAAAGGFAKISSLAEEISRMVPRIVPTLGTVAAMLKEAQQNTSFVTQLHNALANSPVMQFRDQFAGMRQLALSPQFQALVEEARRSDSFIERIAASMATLAANPDDDEPIEAVETMVGERAATLQRGTVTLGEMLGILSLVVMILIWADQKRDGARSDRHLQTLVAIMEKVQAQLAPLPEQSEEIRIVIEPLKVRVAPDLDAENVALLRPGQRVNVTARAESWIEVEYFDGESGSVKKGWVAAIYTKEIAEE